MQGDAGGSELTCRDGGAAAAWAMATEETRGRRGGVGGEARTDGRRRRKKSSRGLEEPRRLGEYRPVSAGRRCIPTKTRLPQGREARVVGFQMDMCRGPWKIAAWASFPRKRPVSLWDSVLPKWALASRSPPLESPLQQHSSRWTRHRPAVGTMMMAAAWPLSAVAAFSRPPSR